MFCLTACKCFYVWRIFSNQIPDRSNRKVISQCEFGIDVLDASKNNNLPNLR